MVIALSGGWDLQLTFYNIITIKRTASNEGATDNWREGNFQQLAKAQRWCACPDECHTLSLVAG